MKTRPLVELNPTWITYTLDRRGQGIAFDCPVCDCHCHDRRLEVWFRNPLDGGPYVIADNLATRDGMTYETITVAGPVRGKCGHGVSLERGQVFFTDAGQPPEDTGPQAV